MKSICHRFALLAVGLVMTCAIGHAKDAAQVRRTIERGLQFLGKAGDDWMAERNCLACHHMPLLIQAHAEAQRRGFNVDQRKLDEWTDWSLLGLDRSQGGIEVLAELAVALPAAAPQLRPRLLAAQQKDGLWNPGNQFLSMQQRTPAEAREATTRLTLLALLALDGDLQARDRALAGLGPIKAADSTETLAWRALLAKGDETNAAIAELLKRQRPDGGWAWRTGEWISDSLATGEVLYSLKGVPSATEAVARGRDWLVSHQAVDGSWPIQSQLISKLSRKDFTNVNAIYAFWGTAWATIGLLQEVPVARVAVK